MKPNNKRGRLLSLPSPAMAVALVALFVATGGSAWATKHYLLSSSSQVSPKLLKKLKGASGAKGATGAAGATGPAGAAGAVGKNGANGANGTNGTNGVDGSSLGLYAFKDGPVALTTSSGEQTVATLANVPPGSYLFIAKAVVENGPGAVLQLRCRMTAEGDFDESTAQLQKESAEAATVETLPFVLGHTFAATGAVVVTCKTAGASGVKVRNIKITGSLEQSLTVSGA